MAVHVSATSGRIGTRLRVKEDRDWFSELGD